MTPSVVARRTGVTPHIAEGMHWYDSRGLPAYTVKAKDGTDRPATLRDARKLNLLPSVTSIIRCAAAPGLEHWKQNQVLMAALTLPKQENESEQDYMNRIMQDSKEQARKAAERGTEIHAAIQGYYEGKSVHKGLWMFVENVVEAVKDWAGEQEWTPEQSFAHGLGFGGKVDLSSQGYVLDFKTKDWDYEGTLKVWDEHAMQLAAYRVGLSAENAKCAIVFVSTKVPGLVHLAPVKEEHLQRGWQMFQGLLAYWKAKNDYQPKLEWAQ